MGLSKASQLARDREVRRLAMQLNLTQRKGEDWKTFAARVRKASTKGKRRRG